MANDHFVQRALINFWSKRDRNGSWSGLVWVYDFKEKSLEQDLVASGVLPRGALNQEEGREVGAAQGLRTKPTAFGAAVHDYVADPTKAAHPQTFLDEPRVKRAISLSFLVQEPAASTPSRTASAISRSPDADARRGSSMRMPTTSGVRHHIGSSMNMPESAEILLFDTGLYIFPVLDPHRGEVWGHALPMGPRSVLYALPRGVKFEMNVANTDSIVNCLGRHQHGEHQGCVAAVARRDGRATRPR